MKWTVQDRNVTDDWRTERASAERKVNVWLQALAASDLMLCVALLPHGLMTYGNRLIYANLSFHLLYQAMIIFIHYSPAAGGNNRYKLNTINNIKLITKE